MKKSVAEFFKANGFYVSFGVGVVALVAALAVYNVNSGKDKQQNQEINLNEPTQEEVANANAEVTEEIQSTVADGDMDVPMDMWKTDAQDEAANDTEHEDTDITSTEAVAAVAEEAPEAEEVISNDAQSFIPLEGLSFEGVEEVTMPVLGNTILPYSMDTTVYFKTLGTYRCNPGMLLQAPAGTDVVSIWHGQVTNIQDTKEYGTVVTVDLGSGYQVSYGQLQDIRVGLGDEVWNDTILGTVAEPTSYYEKEGSHLYLSVTKDGETMNPMDIIQVE